MNYAEHKAMLAALEAGTATPDQQRAAFAHLLAVKRQHNAELRETPSTKAARTLILRRAASLTGRIDAISC